MQESRRTSGGGNRRSRVDESRRTSGGTTSHRGSTGIAGLWRKASLKARALARLEGAAPHSLTLSAAAAEQHPGRHDATPAPHSLRAGRPPEVGEGQAPRPRARRRKRRRWRALRPPPLAPPAAVLGGGAIGASVGGRRRLGGARGGAVSAAQRHEERDADAVAEKRRRRPGGGEGRRGEVHRGRPRLACSVAYLQSYLYVLAARGNSGDAPRQQLDHLVADLRLAGERGDRVRLEVRGDEFVLLE